MALFVVEHAHPGSSCPAKDPQAAAGLLQIVTPERARQHGVAIHGEAVAAGQHHLYLIVEAADVGTARTYFAPFAHFGSLTVTPASRCEEVVARGAC